jgi:hypothetical protein
LTQRSLIHPRYPCPSGSRAMVGIRPCRGGASYTPPRPCASSNGRITEFCRTGSRPCTEFRLPGRGCPA